MDMLLSGHLPRESELTPRLVSSLYVEAMVLADEVRGYFDESGKEERNLLAPHDRVTFSCESLKITTRLMHIIAWLLTRRAVETGEIDIREASGTEMRLGDAAETDIGTLGVLPARARQLILASLELYDRVARLDSGLMPDMPVVSPARALLRRLEAAF